MSCAATVIIPVHNAAATLADQLEALARQVDHPDFEVIVVFNRCTDDSRSVAEPYCARLRTTFVEANDRGSAAHARNVGAAHARSAILLFCDADDRVAPNWVAEMVRPLQSGMADLVGGRIDVDRHGLSNAIYRARYEQLDGRALYENRGVLYALSASLGCQRSRFEEVGGFDESFAAAGGEEVDLSLRMQRAGSRIVPASTAAIAYRPRTTLTSVLAQMRSYAAGGAVLAAKEGRLDERPSHWAVLMKAARHLAYWIVRKRVFNPVELLLRVGWILQVSVADRRIDRRIVQPPPDLVDFTVPVSTPVIGGLCLVATPATQRWYHRQGIEQRSLAVVRALLETGDTFVDVGANIGEFSVVAGLCGAQVVAFEPAELPARGLRRNIARHGVAASVQVRTEGVSSTPGTAMLINFSNDVVSSFSVAPSVFSPGAEVSRKEVAVTTLDEALLQRVDMVKIDVEGHEPAVLDGASRLFDQNPDLLLLVEVSPTTLRHAGSSLDELLRRLPAARWRLLLIGDRTEPAYQWIDDSVIEALHSAADEWYGNLLAVPPHRLEEVRRRLDGV